MVLVHVILVLCYMGVIEIITISIKKPKINSVKFNMLCVQVVLITDGGSTVPQLTRRQADLIHYEGILVFAIGVSKSVNETELKIISSDPDEKYTFLVEDWHALDRIKKEVVSGTCCKFFKKEIILHVIIRN